MADLFLERSDLLEFNDKTYNIKVDKSVFDDFVRDTYINICFVDWHEDEVFQYLMVSEDNDGINMELF